MQGTKLYATEAEEGLETSVIAGHLHEGKVNINQGFCMGRNLPHHAVRLGQIGALFFPVQCNCWFPPEYGTLALCSFPPACFSFVWFCGTIGSVFFSQCGVD